MIRHSETRVVGVAPDVMYGVVADIERYPEFLPWVVGLTVKTREQRQGCSIALAEMTVGYGPLHEKYTSRVTANPVARSIDVVQTEGPFRVLENHWHFSEVQGGCRVEFSIVFEFRSWLLDRVAGNTFAAVMRRMAGAFEQRACALQISR